MYCHNTHGTLYDAFYYLLYLSMFLCSTDMLETLVFHPCTDCSCSTRRLDDEIVRNDKVMSTWLERTACRLKTVGCFINIEYTVTYDNIQCYNTYRQKDPHQYI